MFRGCTKAQILNVFEDDSVYNTDKSSIKMYAYTHQMYVASEKMKEVKRTLTNSNSNSICRNVTLIQIPRTINITYFFNLFTDDLRELKREKRRCERKYLSTCLTVDI